MGQCRAILAALLGYRYQSYNYEIVHTPKKKNRDLAFTRKPRRSPERYARYIENGERNVEVVDEQELIRAHAAKAFLADG